MLDGLSHLLPASRTPMGRPCEGDIVSVGKLLLHGLGIALKERSLCHVILLDVFIKIGRTHALSAPSCSEVRGASQWLMGAFLKEVSLFVSPGAASQRIPATSI